MCDNNKNSKNNNNNVYQRQQQTWLLKPLLQLLLLGLLIQQQQQYVVLVNATSDIATFHQSSYNIEHDSKDAALNLAATSLLVEQQQQQQQRNVATFDTEDVVDSSLSTTRKLLAVADSVKSNAEVGGGSRSSSSAVVGTLNDMEDDIADNTDVVESGNDEDMDRIELSGYANDFNMQHEASIPEDIVDQRHIEDEQQNVEGDGEEDIILESQRSTIRNFTSYNNNNNNNESHDNNNKNYNRDDDVDDDNSGNSNNYKRKKKKINNNSYSKNHQHKKLRNNQHHHFEISVAIENDDEQQNADDKNGSFKNEKLKNIQQQQQQLNGADQLDEIVNLNELKFNKLTVAENLNNNDEDKDDDDVDDGAAIAADEIDFKWSNSNNKEQQQQAHNEDAKNQKDEQQKAIGDIEENNFRNDAAWEADFVNDNDAFAATSDDDDDSNNDEDDVKISDATTVPATTTTKTTTPKTIIFVGRKTKRHGTALRQQQQQQQEQFIADQQYDGEQQQQILYDTQEHTRHHRYNSDSSNNNNNNNVGNNMHTLQDEQQVQNVEEQKQKLLVKPDYSISYFGISTANGNNTTTNTQKDMRAGATNIESFSMSDSSSSSSGNSKSRGQVVLKVINEDDVTLSQHSDNVTPTLTAFEQHKAQRRNNRRTGHKSHKKKYKDYLRYALATTATTTAIQTATQTTTTQAPIMAEMATRPTAVPSTIKDKNKIQLQQQEQQQQRQQQRLAKLKQYKTDIKSIEKTRQLPAATAPIFVLTNHRVDAAAATTDVISNVGAVSEVTIRPYYEGQLSYYMETRDDEGDLKNMPGSNVGKLITSETGSNNWYRRMQPILRNGMTKQREHKHHHHHHHPHEQHMKQQNQHHDSHHHHQHQHHHHQHNHHSHSQQHENRKHLQEDEQQQQQQSATSDFEKVGHRDQPAVQHNAYQRRLSTNKKDQQTPYRPRYTPYSPLETPTAPLPPPSYRGAKQQKPNSDGAIQELGHQITQMEEFDRYYRKWPHLARVQYQLNDEKYRAMHEGALEGVNSETEYDYQLATDELEGEFDNDDDDEDDDAEDANLPPYIKKYNRRNKQLLNLLEGTLPPPTPPKRIIWSSSVLQPGPRDAAPVRVDDDYLKEKRRRYQKQHNGGNAKQLSANKDLFAEQRDANERLSSSSSNVDDDATATATTTTTKPWQALNLHVAQDEQQQERTQSHNPSNVIPGDDVDVSASSSQEFDDWEKEIAASVKGSEKMKWQIEKSAAAAPTTTTTPTTSTTLRPAVFRLPSYPGFAGSFIGKPRSRSSQFAPSSGSSIISSGSRLLPGIVGNRAGNSFITNAFHAGNYKSARDSESNNNSNNNLAPPTSVPPPSPTVTAAVKPLSNSFVYHRVEAAPRVVGAGSTGHKQRLPFVAITDRRLETSKKSLALFERQQRDFEQNHYPMP